jgi:Transposase DNA-binding
MEHDGAADAWFDRELSDCRFVDERLGRRLRQLVQRMEGAMGASIPLACQDWANTKAAYRFFSNDRVSEEEILAGHFQATRSRFAATVGPTLVLQDTTEFTFQRERVKESGRRGSASPTRSTAARTSPAVSGCTRCAGF